ncbi:hypothetical protein AQJ46_43770 [Streptomyces canus]|uniref:Uncharacterized protein n=1 Tax=Streptomyces canus TaxID=58343 RepID=A0A101RME4_9ACTN|nr:hypothetical protein AQJ46_43770 [Streptomyces canus]
MRGEVGDLGDHPAGGRIVDVEGAGHARCGEVEVGQDPVGVGEDSEVGVGEGAHGGHLASWAERTVSMAAISCRNSPLVELTSSSA